MTVWARRPLAARSVLIPLSHAMRVVVIICPACAPFFNEFVNRAQWNKSARPYLDRSEDAASDQSEGKRATHAQLSSCLFHGHEFDGRAIRPTWLGFHADQCG
jgi:hypothetical protein